MSALDISIFVGYRLGSNCALTFSPLVVVVAAMRFTTTSWLTSGLPRQFMLI